MKAVGRGLQGLFYYKCPQCKEMDYDKVEENKVYGERWGTAYRGTNGQLSSNWSKGCDQVQARYLIERTTWRLTCKKCRNVWREDSKREVIA